MRLLVLALLLACGLARAHPLAPALLELRETVPDRYAVLWRTSVTRSAGVEVAPQLPEACREVVAPAMRIEDEALVARWTVDCPGGLAGRRIAVANLGRGGIAAILRIADRRGRSTNTLLDGGRDAVVVEPRTSSAGVLLRYAGLGMEHLLRGPDHLLFIAGLVLLVRRGRALVVTITAFTAGHSLTLALATLGIVAVDARVMELGIAASILVLACALARGGPPSPLARRPWLMASAFGLLHGLGFAGALAGIGLPAGDVAIALAGFNAGIEAGQLAAVGALLGAGALWRRTPLPARPALATYLIGSCAAFWCIDRALVLFD